MSAGSLVTRILADRARKEDRADLKRRMEGTEVAPNGAVRQVKTAEAARNRAHEYGVRRMGEDAATARTGMTNATTLQARRMSEQGQTTRAGMTNSTTLQARRMTEQGQTARANISETGQNFRQGRRIGSAERMHADKVTMGENRLQLDAWKAGQDALNGSIHYEKEKKYNSMGQETGEATAAYLHGRRMSNDEPPKTYHPRQMVEPRQVGTGASTGASVAQNRQIAGTQAAAGKRVMSGAGGGQMASRKSDPAPTKRQVPGTKAPTAVPTGTGVVSVDGERHFVVNGERFGEAEFMSDLAQRLTDPSIPDDKKLLMMKRAKSYGVQQSQIDEIIAQQLSAG